MISLFLEKSKVIKFCLFFLICFICIQCKPAINKDSILSENTRKFILKGAYEITEKKAGKESEKIEYKIEENMPPSNIVTKIANSYDALGLGLLCMATDYFDKSQWLSIQRGWDLDEKNKEIHCFTMQHLRKDGGLIITVISYNEKDQKDNTFQSKISVLFLSPNDLKLLQGKLNNIK